MQVHHSARPQQIAPTTSRSDSPPPLHDHEAEAVGATLGSPSQRWASNSAALGDSTHYMTNSLAAPFVYHEGIT